MSGDQFDGPKWERIGADGSLGGGIQARHGVAGFAGELHTADGDGETVHAVGDVSFGAVGVEDVPGEVVVGRTRTALFGRPMHPQLGIRKLHEAARPRNCLG